MTIRSLMASEKAAKFAKSTAGAVVATTILKAAVRPAFIMGDNKSDKETKTYTAAKEFLYQALCLGIALLLIPVFKEGGYRLAKKFLSKDPKIADAIKNAKTFERLKEDHSFTDNLPEDAKKTLKTVNGGVELGAFVGSILGLTLLAPAISHKILHPIMHAMGMDKKKDIIGKPAEVFLADAKVSTEKTSKLNVNA